MELFLVKMADNEAFAVEAFDWADAEELANGENASGIYRIEQVLAAEGEIDVDAITAEW